MATATQIKRIYGVERTIGDIIHNRENNSVFVNIEGGFFGRATVSLTKDTQHGGYNLLRTYKTKDGAEGTFTAGKTFPVKDKNGNVVEGLTQGRLGLLREFNKEANKELVVDNDMLQITTHKLKSENHKRLGESNLYKVGYITGRFVIEAPQEQSAAGDFASTESEHPTIDVTDEEIPF